MWTAMVKIKSKEVYGSKQSLSNIIANMRKILPFSLYYKPECANVSVTKIRKSQFQRH